MISIENIISVLIPMIILVVAVMWDLRTDRIPNPLIGLGLCLGALLELLSLSGFGWWGFLAGMALPLLICWIPFRMGALGAGDVKLMMVVGCFLGGSDILYGIFISFLFAAGISLSKLLSLRQCKSSLICCYQLVRRIVSCRELPENFSVRRDGNTIHFSVAVLWGYAILLGVKACRNMPFF